MEISLAEIKGRHAAEVIRTDRGLASRERAARVTVLGRWRRARHRPAPNMSDAVAASTTPPPGPASRPPAASGTARHATKAAQHR